MTEQRNSKPAQLILAVVGLVALLFLVFTLNGLRNRAEIIDVGRSSPATVNLTVGSCNRDPFIAEIEESGPGTFEVLVRTQLPSQGQDCLDSVELEVDPDYETITVIDRVSGATFDAPSDVVD